MSSVILTAGLVKVEKKESDLFFFQILNMADNCKQQVLSIKTSDGEMISEKPHT